MLLASLLLSCSLRLALYASLATSVVDAQNRTTKTTAGPPTTTTVGPTTTTTAAGPTTATTTSAEDAQNTTQAAPSQIVTSSNDFAVSLYKAIGELYPGENLFLSPIAISYGLAMLYAGAGGRTKSQLATAMRLENNTDPQTLGTDFRDLVKGVNRNTTRYVLQLASCLFAQKNFKIKAAFLKTMNESFGAAIENLDFEIDPEAARKRINDWVANRTTGKLSNLLDDDSISAETTLLLAETAYFKGFWLYAFNKNSTKSGKFYVSSRKTTNAVMMRQQQARDLNYYNSTELGCQVLELPYEGLFASMYIVLPHDVDGLAKLENNITLMTIATVLAALKEERVLVTMPKFTMDKGTSIMQALGKLGVVDLFDSSKADLSGLDGSKRRAMADIVQKAYVSVDEDGKVSAAMPALGATVTIERVKFHVNRPFHFCVMDKATRSILFMGRVVKPLVEKNSTLSKQ